MVKIPRLKFVRFEGSLEALALNLPLDEPEEREDLLLEMGGVQPLIYQRQTL